MGPNFAVSLPPAWPLKKLSQLPKPANSKVCLVWSITFLKQLLGAKKADGVDIDPVAVKVATENAQLNNVGVKTKYILGDLCDKISGKYEVVCANIVADVIISLLGNVENFMKDDAVFLCSGIIDIRENDVREAFKKFGFYIVDDLECENWRAFAVKKRR